jgi:NAD(P)H-nitrite reductase large subunit
MPKYVIIGGSVGGIGAVEAIREVDPLGELTVISEEPFPQYSRPMISEYVSKEAIVETMKYRGDKFWKRNNVQALTGKTAVKIDFAKKQVELDGGDIVDFEKLLIATGGRPFVPRMEGGDKDGVFTFTELSSAKGIESKLEKAKSAVVIGGGLIGVSASEALVKRGIKVTLVELKEKILSLILDEQASEIAEKTLRNAGVDIITGQTVQKIVGRKDSEGFVGGVIMTDGTEIPCDLVVVAIGVIPRTELVKETNVKINRGILVDRFMRTNIRVRVRRRRRSPRLPNRRKPPLTLVATGSHGWTSSGIQHGGKESRILWRHSYELPEILRPPHNLSGNNKPRRYQRLRSTG